MERRYKFTIFYIIYWFTVYNLVHNVFNNWSVRVQEESEVILGVIKLPPTHQCKMIINSPQTP